MSTITISGAATISIPSVGSPIVAVDQGTFSLDAGRAPYATATVTIPRGALGDDYPSDPRTGNRVELTVTDGWTSRTFDAAIDSRTIDYAARTITLTLTSDEPLVQRHTALEDWIGGVAMFSLADLVNYVLDQSTGDSLTYHDGAFITPLAASENLIRNPRVGAGITDWNASGHAASTRRTVGGPAGCPTYMEFQAGSGGAGAASIFLDQNAISIDPGRRYVLSAYVRAYGARAVDLDAILFDVAGNTLAYTTPVRRTPAGAWVRLEQTFYGVTGAARLRPRVTLVGGMAANEYYNITGWRLAVATGDDIADSDYFDGATADTADYDYSWAGTVHASISQRRPLRDEPTPEALIWRTGDTAWDYLQPLLTRYNRRLFCDEQRNWRLVNPDTYELPQTIVVTPATSTGDATEVIALGNTDEYATGVIVRYRWTSLENVQMERLDVAGTPEQVRVIPLNRAWPGNGAAAAILARMNGRGRDIQITALADLTATPGMTAEILTPESEESFHLLGAVEWNLRARTMSIVAKGVGL